MARKILAAIAVILIVVVGVLAYSFFRPPEEASGPIEAIPLDVNNGESTAVEAGGDTPAQADSVTEPETEVDTVVGEVVEPTVVAEAQVDAAQEIDSAVGPEIPVETDVVPDTETEAVADAESEIVAETGAQPPSETSEEAISPSDTTKIEETTQESTSSAPTLQEYPVPSGSRPHDVAPAPDGSVWYTAQGSGDLGRLDPNTGKTRHIALGAGSAPHGVIVGPDGAPWITDGGLNAIVRVDPVTEEVKSFPLPSGSGYANLNTATFSFDGVLWFTGQSGVYGRLDPLTEQVEVFAAPRGRGPYGISTTADGTIYYASLAGSYVGRLDFETAGVTVLEPPTPDQGARRVWPDSQGRIWVSEWEAGQVAVYDPVTGEWREWRLPGDNPRAYAVYVDEQDMVWLSDFGANALVRFNPIEEAFEVFSLPSPGANVRQILGRPGEVWGAESGTDKLVVIRTS